MNKYTYVTNLNALSLHPNAQLRVFSDSSLDDVRDVLQCRGKVLQPIVTQSSVVREVGVVADHLLGRAELGQRLAVPPLLVQQTGQVDLGVRVVGGTLVHQRFRSSKVFLPVPDCSLQLEHAALVLGALHGHRHLHRLLVQGGRVEGLRVVHPVVLLVGVVVRELLVAVGCVHVVLHVVVAVG